MKIKFIFNFDYFLFINFNLIFFNKKKEIKFKK